MKYVKKRIPVEASQWFSNGDHPDDYVGDLRNADGSVTSAEARREMHMEGEVVRYFRHPGVHGNAVHGDLPGTGRPHCIVRMAAHGWIDTIEGGHTVCPGDWIITGVRGERYPCEPSIFAETYEPDEDVPGAGKHRKPLPCVDHYLIQHRDGKPPWCHRCGLTATGELPTSMFRRKQKGTPS